MKAKRQSSGSAWKAVPLAEAAMVNPPEALPPADHGAPMVPLYEMAEIDEFAGMLRSPRSVPLGSCRSGRTRFRNGDVLFAKITPCVQNGKCALADGIPGDLGFGSSEFYVVRAGPNLLPEYLFYFLRQKTVVQAAVDSFSGTSGRQRVPPQFWERLSFPLPPLPVQERIVQILQKADEIRRKRKEALDLADKLLPALFLDMFGDPATNPKRWPLKTLGECSIIRRGLSRRPSPNGRVKIVRIRNLTLRGLDLSWSEKIEASQEEIERTRLLPGDIVFSPLNGSIQHLAKSDVFNAPESEVWLLDSNLCAFRAKERYVRSSYLGTFLSLPSTLELFRNRLAVKTSGGQWLLKTSTLQEVRCPVPPLQEQDYFSALVEQHVLARQKYEEALREAEACFSALLSQAFTGQLTAEWEAANAEAIRQRQAFEEQVPRLVALDLLAEKAGSAAPAAPEAGLLLTAMMKLLFLVQMKGSARRRFYHFVHYHYGPFAKELYDDLERLQQDGLVRMIEHADEDKTRLLLADADRAGQMVAQLPDDLRQDVRAILDEYGGLTHDQLLARVYEEFPAYARRSRLRKNKKK